VEKLVMLVRKDQLVKVDIQAVEVNQVIKVQLGHLDRQVQVVPEERKD